MDPSRLSGQVIVITGGSRGIGLATAKALVGDGARVVLFARTAAALEGAVDSLGRAQAVGVPVDVCDRAAVVGAFEFAARRWGRVDGLVNNVGFQFARRIELMPEPEVRRMVDLNFLSAVFCCQAVIPWLRRAGGGRIVNVSSSTVRHRDEFAHLGLYSASKAALEHFSVELREELRQDGITVSVVSSGAVATGSVANFDPAALREAMAAWLEKGTMTSGMMAPEAIGAAIAQCFDYPPGVAAEFLEVRPQRRVPKALEERPHGLPGGEGGR